MLEDEGKGGTAGEADEAYHFWAIERKLNNHEDISKEDLPLLEKNGFDGYILYKELNYRRQKDGSWRWAGHTGTPTSGNNAAPQAQAKSQSVKPVQGKAVPVKQKQSKTQQKKPAPKQEIKFVSSLMAKGGRIQKLDARQIQTGDGKIPNFKENANTKTGVVKPLSGTPDEMMAGLPIVMEFEDGHYETVTGRHRIHLFAQHGLPINCLVIKHGEAGEAGTFTIEDAQTIDAKANILDGQGTVRDYIKFFKNSKMTKDEAQREGLLDREKGQQAFALYNDATSDLVGMVDFDGTRSEDGITPDQAGIIALNAPKDGGANGDAQINGAVQRSMANYCIQHPKVKGAILANMTQQKIRQLMTAKKQGQLKANGGGQMFLFGDMAADNAANETLEKIEKFKTQRAGQYKKIANAIRDAANSNVSLNGTKVESFLSIDRDSIEALGLQKYLYDADGNILTDKKALKDAADQILKVAHQWTLPGFSTGSEVLDRTDLPYPPSELQDIVDREFKLGKYAEQQDLPQQNNGGKKVNLTPEKKEKPNASLTLESSSQEEVNAERKKSKQDAAMKERAERPLKGGTGEIGQPQMDLGDTNGDLFNPVVPNAPKGENKQANEDNEKELANAKAAADKHVVSYGNGGRDTLANMIKSGHAKLYPKNGLTTFDEGARVITLGFEQFAPTRAELPYLIKLQDERNEKDRELFGEPNTPKAKQPQPGTHDGKWRNEEEREDFLGDVLSGKIKANTPLDEWRKTHGEASAPPQSKDSKTEAKGGKNLASGKKNLSDLGLTKGLDEIFGGKDGVKWSSREFDENFTTTNDRKYGIIYDNKKRQKMIEALATGQVQWKRFKPAEVAASKDQRHDRLWREIFKLSLGSSDMDGRGIESGSRVYGKNGSRNRGTGESLRRVGSSRASSPVADFEARYKKLGSGVESEVFDTEDGSVVKVRKISPLDKSGLLDYLSNIVYHNYLFQNDAYTLLDVARHDHDGYHDFYLILRQPFVSPKLDANGNTIAPSYFQIAEELSKKKLGFRLVREASRQFNNDFSDSYNESSDDNGEVVEAAKYILANGDYAIYDFKPGENTFIDSKTGNVRFIDPRIHLNYSGEHFSYSHLGERTRDDSLVPQALFDYANKPTKTTATSAAKIAKYVGTVYGKFGKEKLETTATSPEKAIANLKWRYASEHSHNPRLIMSDLDVLIDSVDGEKYDNNVMWSSREFDDDDTSRPRQTILSGGTSLNQNPAGNVYAAKAGIFKKGGRNIDIGAGKYEKASQFLADNGVTNIPFDPVNRDSETNRRAAEEVRANPADTATVHNVLNVIDNDAVMDGIINQAARGIKKNGTAIFTIYDGDRSAKGKVTSRGYQRNERATLYVPRIEKYFDKVEVHGNVLVAKNPKDVGPAFWAFDSSFDNGIQWMSRDFSDLDENQKRVHAFEAGQKVVKLLASKGLMDFKNFANTLAAYNPEIYKQLRPYLKGIWEVESNQNPDLEEIDRKTTKEILETIDSELTENTTEETNETPTAPEAKKTKGEKISAAADELVKLIENGTKFNRQTLEQIVGKHLGGSVAEGTFEMKDATDILELAINRYILNHANQFDPALNVSADAAYKVINNCRKILEVIPTATTRSSKQDKMQQFSTPPHEAFVAAWVANVNENDVSLEPSAGIGGIAVFSRLAGAKLILNELDADGRAKILEQLGIAPKVYNFNAEDLWAMFYPLVNRGEVQRPTVVVMNPPFSNSQRTDKKDTIGVGGKHIEEALQMLAPNGRLVAIVGHGMAHDSDSAKVRAWWNKIGSQYTVRADVTVNGQEYAKYGTSYDNNIIVIDKVDPKKSANTIEPIYGIIHSIDDLPAMLEGVRNDRPRIDYTKTQPTASEQGGGGNSRQNGGTPRPESSGNPGVGGSQGGQGGTGVSKSGQSQHLHSEGNERGGSSVRPHGHNRGAHTGNGGANNRGVAGDGRNGGGNGGLGNQQSNSGAVGDAGTTDSGVSGVNYTTSDTALASTREVGNGTFSEYRPSKVNIPDAKPHPTPLVESTAMASVLPPDPTYQPKLPEKIIKSGQPSEAQIEQIIYAGQAHEQKLPNGERRGYFIGDGTGVGKGTEIAGIICDNFNHGRKKAVWITKSSNLFGDAQRDLKTFDMEGEVFPFDPKKKGVLARSRGIAFMSYDGLSHKVGFDTNGNVVSLEKDKLNRFQHLVNWLGKDFDGVIVFDECHKAANAVSAKGKRGTKKPSNIGRAVVALQKALPNARILYVSATGATEVSNFAYATRLGLWGEGTAFRDRDQFIEKVSSGGLSVMEVVARDMKSMGAYMARTLSYEGIINRKLEHKLSVDQMRKYDEFADAWQLVSENIKNALVSSGGINNGRAIANVMSQFWSGQQRFFNQVLTAMQMPSIIADAKKQIAAGNSVVFQLVNTNEAAQKRAIQKQKDAGEEVNPEELDLSPRDILVQFVEHSFPTHKYVEQTNADGKSEWVVLVDSEGRPVEDPIAVDAKNKLKDKLNMMTLDGNPIDIIISEFGADKVAEITGRSKRPQLIHDSETNQYKSEFVSRTARIREQEIDEFNNGDRNVLVFSDAGGTGKSFHADKRFKNQSKRIHYLVQAGWRADGALQGFGRTHRSNEKQPPEYVLCSTDIRGHQRFISTVARRLAQLGSLTAGDRSSAGSGVFSEEDNLENPYAAGAVRQLFVEKYQEDYGRFNALCKQLGFVKLSMDKETGEPKEINTLIDENHGLDMDALPTVPTFLNRILNCRVDTQNKLFDEFLAKMRDAIETAKDNGSYDPGLEKLQGDSIEETNRTELWSANSGTGSTDMVEVEVGKKTKKPAFSFILKRMESAAQGRDYYFARNITSGKIFGFSELSQTKTDERGRIHERVRCFTVDGGTQVYNKDSITFDGEKAKYERLLDGEAEELWKEAQDKLPELQKTKRYFVHGTLLPIWDRLGATNPRIFRISPTGKDGSFLGLEINPNSVNDVLRRFGKTPQSIELTPASVLERIAQQGKVVPLLHQGWELRRAKVNGDYRIELKGPESLKELQDLEADRVGTIERIAYTPRFFIPRTEEGVAAFLAKYPAMPEGGGLDTVGGTGVNYMAMTDTERRNALIDKFDLYKQAYMGYEGDIDKTYNDLMNVVTAMSNGELFREIERYQDYDNDATGPTHNLRQMFMSELKKRDAWTEKDSANYALWFSREFEDDLNSFDDGVSAIALRNMNKWRVARSLPEMPRRPKTTVEAIHKKGKYMASNEDEMARFVRVSAQTPHNWTAEETDAAHIYRKTLGNDFDAKTELINEAIDNGNLAEAAEIRKARDEVEQKINELDRANKLAASEWGRAGITRRFLLDRNNDFVGLLGDLKASAGRKLTPDEEAGAKVLWDAYVSAQGKLDDAMIQRTSEILKDILRKQFADDAKKHRIGDTKTLKEIEDEYQAAMDHCVVHANRAGGVLIGLPNGRKWVDAIRRYHFASLLESGKKAVDIDPIQMVDLIRQDLLSAGILADSHDIMQMITGHGNTYEADNSELEKGLREQRRLLNEYQKWEDMLNEAHMPDKTGLLRDDPTQREREIHKRTREMMKEFIASHPELLSIDKDHRLKSVQDSIMKRMQNEMEDLEKAIATGEALQRKKGSVEYTPEMEDLRNQLKELRKEYKEMFPPEPITHEEKLNRYLKVLTRRLNELDAKKTALQFAKTDEERAAILGKRKGEEFNEEEVAELKNKIDEVKNDIQDLHDLYFPEGTPEELTATVNRRIEALRKNIERYNDMISRRDFSPHKRELSAIAKRVALNPEVIRLTKERNAALKAIQMEREKYKRSVLPYNAGRMLDWGEAIFALPRVLRTMLDLSATLTQGAALFQSHPAIGFDALKKSILAFGSEMKSDEMMTMLMNDPDFTEFIEMDGHAYMVGEVDDPNVLPEDFRGINQKLITIKGKQYALSDIPGVKASERSFGLFLNWLNLGIYKAAKQSNGWGPTGPSIMQKKDLATALNVMSGRGYDSKGNQGFWDRLASWTLWAPRFAVSGLKQAVGWSIIAPQFNGNTTERSYADRMTSSKQAAKEWVRQQVAMAVTTLIATVLLGRKDPEWLEEVVNPLSSNFLNVRVGNTNMNFYGPIKQWWTFMARMLTGKAVGRDGMVRARNQGQTLGRFIRGKLSPLAGAITDAFMGKDFLGTKLTWGEPKDGEKSMYSHLTESLVIPLSATDVYDAFKENTLANALFLTPFIIAGAGKSTYELDEYSRLVNPYKAAKSEYDKLVKNHQYTEASELKKDNPILSNAWQIDNALKRVASTKKQIRDLEKKGQKPSENILKRFEAEQTQVATLIRKYKQ
jgi:hypothetical protein